VEVVVAFAGALISLRLAGSLVQRWRADRRLEWAAWGASLTSFAIASGALAWGAAAGWNSAAFKVYYLFGGLLTAALLGAGSLLRAGVRGVAPVALLYCGVAVGVVLAADLTAAVAGTGIPDARDYLEFFPGRVLAIVGNTAGTVAAVGVACIGLRRRRVGNSLILLGIGAAAIGSTVAGLGEGGSAAFSVVAAALLYGGFVAKR
jgi:hypothetical protein